MSPAKIAAAVAGCALLAGLFWFLALRSPEPGASGMTGGHAGGAACCDPAAGRPAPQPAAGAAAAATAVAPSEPAARQAARYGVCDREEAPARLARVGLTAGRAELWALHCGRSLHLVSIEEHGGVLVPLRVAQLQVTSPSPAEVSVAVEPGAADLNGDGRTDLLAPVLLADAAGAPRGGALYALWQRPAGGFEPPFRVLQAAPAALVAAALDVEPVLDLALLNRADANTAQPDELWLFSGGPSPVRFAQRPAGAGTSGLAALDLDLDGKDDLAVPSAREGKVRMWLTSRGTLASVDALELTLPGVQQALVADLDGDRARELLLCADRTYVVRAAAGEPSAPLPIAGSEQLRDLHLADADADGVADLVGYAHPELIALRGGAEQALARLPVASLRGEAAVLYARAAKLDGNPAPDLVLAVLSRDGARVELAIARNLEPSSQVRLADESVPLGDAALIERFTAQ